MWVQAMHETLGTELSHRLDAAIKALSSSMSNLSNGQGSCQGLHDLPFLLASCKPTVGFFFSCIHVRSEHLLFATHSQRKRLKFISVQLSRIHRMGHVRIDGLVDRKPRAARKSGFHTSTTTRQHSQGRSPPSSHGPRSTVLHVTEPKNI